jgi:hypothetical protein
VKLTWNSLSFREHEGSLPHSQQLATQLNPDHTIRHACYTTCTYRNLAVGAWTVTMCMSRSHGHVDAGAHSLTATVPGWRPAGARRGGGDAHLVRIPVLLLVMMEQRHVVRQEARVQGLGRGRRLVHPTVRRPENTNLTTFANSFPVEPDTQPLLGNGYVNETMKWL